MGKRHVFHPRSWYREHLGLSDKRKPHVAFLQYLGGPVETNPVIYLVFWGFSGPNDTTADPDGLAAYLSNFAAALPSSLWLNTLTQYYQTVGITATYITNPVGQLAGIWYDAALPPATYQQSDVANEALDAVSHFGYHANANFIIVTPHGYAATGFPSQFCGYHAATTFIVSGSAMPVPFTNLPYMPDAGADCGAGSVNMPGTLDGASIVGGHEAAETQSDPVVNTGGSTLTMKRSPINALGRLGRNDVPKRVLVPDAAAL